MKKESPRSEGEKLMARYADLNRDLWDHPDPMTEAEFRVAVRRGLGRMAFLLGQRLPLVFYGDYGLVAERD